MGKPRDGISATRYLETALVALRAMPEASVTVFDLDLRYVLVSEQAAAQAGLAACDVEGRLIADVLGTERSLFWEPIYRAALRGEASSVEVQGIDPGRWYRVEVNPWRDESGAVAGGLAVARDITQRRRSQDRIESLLASAPDAMVVVDGDGVIVLVNVQTERLFGYDRGALLGQNIEMLVPGTSLGGDAHQRGYLLGSRGAPIGPGSELSGRRKDGSGFPVEVLLSPLETEAGALTTGVIRDLSERRRLEGLAAHFAAVIEFSPEAIISKTTDGRIVTWNPGAERLYGYTEAEVKGWPISILVPEGHDDEVAMLLARVVAGKRVENFETVRRRKDGSLVSVSLTISAVRDPSGAVVGASTIAHDTTERKHAESQLARAHADIERFFGLALDITERKQMEQDLVTTRQQALEASRLKSEFVANMSHEIRTPLNGVVCMSELLLGTSLSDEQREYARIALTSAEALMRVINDILDFSKIEAGKLEIVHEDFSLAAAADDVCQILAAKAHEKGVELAVSVSPEVPKVVRGDDNRVRQVLLNLVDNAIKFTSDGEIVVSVGVVPAEDSSERLRVEVADTGIGIEADRLGALFQPFSQADSTTTRRYDGTGLGLCIARQLAELMDGEIGVQSTPGAGSSFWFTLPCERGTAVPTGIPVMDLTGARVLIVDDNATNRHVLERRLAAWGLIPDSAGDGRSALDRLHRAANSGRPYEAAVIDMLMPSMDGLELARAIKAAPPLRATRLILLSSLHVPARDARAAGIDAVLSKPVRQSMLCDQLVSSLSRVPKPYQPQEHPEPTTPHRTNSGRVLLAEDNEINQIAARRLLQKFGFTVDIAVNGREAIEASRRVEYAAVFMDCQMPDIDGYMATDIIRLREGSSRHTPIIAMTAHTMKGDREKCLASGMDDYLAKPLRIANVERVLARFFPESYPGDAAAPGPADLVAEQNGVVSSEYQPLINRPVLEEILADGGKEQGLVDLFVKQSYARLQELARAVDDRDAAGTARIAHSLKGSSATFGAVRLANAAGRLAHYHGPALLSEAEILHPELVRILATTEVALADAAAAISS